LSNTYKYLAWTDRGYFQGQKLLSPKQIRIVTSELLQNPKNHDIFTTIGDYNTAGELISCPLYADFDGGGAFYGCQKFVSDIETRFNAIPNFYFSGRKGFHVVLNIKIKHSRCFNVVRHIINDMGQYTGMDSNVYTERRLWRVPGTFNVKGGLFKTDLYLSELCGGPLAGVRHISREYRTPFDHSLEGLDLDAVDESVEQAIELEDTNTTTYDRVEQAIKDDSNWRDNITPCLLWYLTNDPGEGHINSSVCLLARFFKGERVDDLTTLHEILQNPAYSAHTDKVIQWVNAIYNRKDGSGVGCFGNNFTAEIMHRHCSPFCKFSKESI